VYVELVKLIFPTKIGARAKELKNFAGFRDVFVNWICLVLTDDIFYSIQKIARPFTMFICR
jgi:hypothetical protein